MRFTLSVDGGGTKTAFLLRSQDGSTEYRVTDASTSIKSVGLEIAQHNLTAGVTAICHQAGIPLSKIAYAVFGMSGLDSAADEQQIRRMLAELGFSPNRYTLCNDALLAFFAVADPPGMVLIAGTGSIAVGVDAALAVTRSGGWGYGFSDLGSGQWLGTEALKHTLTYCDGGSPFVSWFTQVRDFFGCTSFQALPEIATSLTQYDRIAALAPILLNHSSEPLRDQIVADGANHLAVLLRSTYHRMGPPADAPFCIVLAGGCLQQPDYANALVSSLPMSLRSYIMPPNEPAIPPVEGGIRLAQMHCTERG